MKIVEIVPIYQSGYKLLPTNYKAISLISNTAKLFREINYFSVENNLISNKLIGFKGNIGTNDALFLERRI